MGGTSWAFSHVRSGLPKVMITSSRCQCAIGKSVFKGNLANKASDYLSLIGAPEDNNDNCRKSVLCIEVPSSRIEMSNQRSILRAASIAIMWKYGPCNEVLSAITQFMPLSRTFLIKSTTLSLPFDSALQINKSVCGLM